MIAFPNCKINLGLHIVNKRGDGFHDIETAFYPLPYYDVLEIIKNDKDNSVIFNSSGIEITGKPEDNLCIKAFHLLKKDFPFLAGIQMHLHKTIPLGAGLGGGSSDAAFTLKLLNTEFQLQLTEQQLLDYALELGSDAPFFMINKPCFATGRGEKLEKINMDLSNYKLIIVNPGIHVNTGWAFSQITPSLPSKSIKDIIQQPIKDWKEVLVNDFEFPIFKTHPDIQAIKDTLYQQGALYASMSGSGSTVYGIFEKERKTELSFPKNYFVRELAG